MKKVRMIALFTSLLMTLTATACTVPSEPVDPNANGSDSEITTDEGGTDVNTLPSDVVTADGTGTTDVPTETTEDTSGATTENTSQPTTAETTEQPTTEEEIDGPIRYGQWYATGFDDRYITFNEDGSGTITSVNGGVPISFAYEVYDVYITFHMDGYDAYATMYVESNDVMYLTWDSGITETLYYNSDDSDSSNENGQSQSQPSSENPENLENSEQPSDSGNASSGTIKSGIWSATGLDYDRYFCFYDDGTGGQFLSKDTSRGLAFDYEIDGSSAVFHFGAADNSTNGEISFPSDNQIIINWEDGTTEYLEFVQEGTFDDFSIDGQ